MKTKKQETLSELCNSVKLSHTCAVKAMPTGWRKDMKGYRCTLKYKNRQYAFDFWQGKGIKTYPTAEGCMECLLLDASCGESTFKDFCSEMGYSTDSRAALETFKACQHTTAALKRLLAEDYGRFMNADR